MIYSIMIRNVISLESAFNLNGTNGSLHQTKQIYSSKRLKLSRNTWVLSPRFFHSPRDSCLRP